MKTGTKMDIRKDCKLCGQPLPAGKRTFCCPAHCRIYNNKKNQDAIVARNREKYDREASIPSEDKVQCLLCGKWYVQLGGHIFQRHNMTAREYREEMRLDVKRGTVPSWYRELKGEQALENGTFKNLVAGQKFRFKKGQPGLGKYARGKETLARLKQKSFIKKPLNT